MKLYFLRHGYAESGANSTDEARQLTPEGMKRIGTAAQVMAALNLTPLRIYCSPRVRARQTAEIVSAALQTPFEVREEVNFGFDLQAVKTLLQVADQGQDILFVGHQPTLSIVIQHLTGAEAAMLPGGLACVEMMRLDPLQGVLLWLIASEVFDVLGLEAT